MIRPSIVVPPLATLLVLISASCAPGNLKSRESLPEQTVMNDPALSAAAESTGPWLEERFPDSFAGLELDHKKRVMIVYRRPDPGLDAELAERVRNVDVVVRDARYSLAAMTATVDRVLADQDYWRNRELPITGVGAAVDGSAVEVYTSGDPGPLADLLSARYPDMSFEVQQRIAVHPIATNPPTAIFTPAPAPKVTIDPRR